VRARQPFSLYFSAVTAATGVRTAASEQRTDHGQDLIEELRRRRWRSRPSL